VTDRASGNGLRDSLHVWAGALAGLRRFFAERGVLEVQTPLARDYAVTEPYQHCFQILDPAASGAAAGFLQPSPESAMKQLLAAGSGSIYQLCKAFRAGESGSNHRTEFTMLEWYRVSYDHLQLMDEVAELVNEMLAPRAVERITWREAFIRHAEVDPATAGLEKLIEQLPESMLFSDDGCSSDPVSMNDGKRRRILDRLLVSRVEPHLGRGCMTFLYDYPADQAALARVRDGSWPVAERFELYIDGLEIANGFHELNDSAEQRRRFERDNRQRKQDGLAEVRIDEPLLDCLDSLPNCAGVALGVDRLIKISTGADAVGENLPDLM